MIPRFASKKLPVFMRIRAKAVDMAVAPSVSEGSGGAGGATSENHCAAPPPRPLALARGDSLVIARFSGASRLPPPPPVSFPQARRMRRRSLGINSTALEERDDPVLPVKRDQLSAVRQ